MPAHAHAYIIGSIFAVSRQVLNITFHVEFAIFSAGCIFPLTFNVSSAFKRRDAALQSLSELKANIIAIYLNMGMFDLSGTARAQVRRGWRRSIGFAISH